MDYGFGARTREFINLKKAGIFYPAKIIRVSLKNTVTTTLLTIETVIVDKPKDKCSCDYGATDAGTGGGMGMY